MQHGIVNAILNEIQKIQRVDGKDKVYRQEGFRLSLLRLIQPIRIFLSNA